MTNAEIADKVQMELLEFVERSSKADATAAETEALPAVARVLLDSVGYGC